MAALNGGSPRAAQDLVDPGLDATLLAGVGSSLLQLFCHIGNVFIDGGQSIQPMAAQMRELADSDIGLINIGGLVSEFGPGTASTSIRSQCFNQGRSIPG